jgi:hypothetical protein
MRAVRRVLASDATPPHLNADNVHYVKLTIEPPSPTVPEGAVLSQLSGPGIKRLLRVGCDGEHAAEQGSPPQGFHALRMKGFTPSA